MKLKELYFNADLYSLIKYINYYENNLDSVIDLISTIDESYKEKRIEKRYEKIDKAKEKICDIYLNKLELQLKLGQLTQDEFDKKVFLNIESYLDFDMNFTEDAVIEETDNYYAIHDKDIKQVISKENVHSKFKPDIDNRTQLNDMFKTEEKPINNNIK
jgi:hypothetical protein